MTTTTLTRGSDWGIFANHGVYANWGDCGEKSDTNATYKKLGDMVIDRFHKLCFFNGISCHWIPQISEVIGEINQSIDSDRLEELRQQAEDEIREQWYNGDISPIYIQKDVI